MEVSRPVFLPRRVQWSMAAMKAEAIRRPNQ
jgi:hypothetical protein